MRNVVAITGNGAAAQAMRQINPDVCSELHLDLEEARQYLLHYTRRLEEGARYKWTIWPYHSLLGSLGHCLVSAVDEAHCRGRLRYPTQGRTTPKEASTAHCQTRQ